MSSCHHQIDRWFEDRRPGNPDLLLNDVLREYRDGFERGCKLFLQELLNRDIRK